MGDAGEQVLGQDVARAAGRQAEVVQELVRGVEVAGAEVVAAGARPTALTPAASGPRRTART
ncbi:hypothetical protein [Saccharothrix texasensis]|uniref:hypothetical protein n=1 Tax=Saccharothrix texasensis TaxID=103734 RepID=UPI000F4CC012|nr:hypothetical protein [Saccharothrix texasensis]